jgi:hypothetical protein
LPNVSLAYEQIVLVGQSPVEGAAIKWALTRMEG